MNLCYEVDNRKLARFTTNEFGIMQALKGIFGGRFEAVRYLFLKVFRIESLFVASMTDNENSKGVFSTTLKIETLLGEFEVQIEDNDIRIISDTGAYYFRLDSCSDVLYLREFNLMKDNLIIVERFSSGYMSLEVHFKDSGKTYFLNIPIRREMTFEPEFCSVIKNNFTIQDLKWFYLKMFYDMQTEYERVACKISLSIWQRLGNEEFLDKGVMLDELTLVNGEIVNYQLGSINFDHEGNPVTVILKDGNYTISGYKSANNTSTALNESIIILERRKQELK